MFVRPPAEIGQAEQDVDTPALIIDLEVFEANVAHMAETVRSLGIAHRPHAKTHKSADIARRQVAAGAVGQCCQKVGEAEVLVAGGIQDVLVSNQIVGQRKIDRLAALAREARIAVCVDDAQNVADLSAAARRFGTELDVLVEIDIGAGRCGTRPGAPAVALAQQVAAAPALTFAGLQAYQGRAQHIRGHGERRQAILNAAELVRETVVALEEAGLSCRLITGAGTGTYPFEAEAGVWNEIQAGSYCFMDADYRLNLDADGEQEATFGQSLFVLATVMSRPTRDRAVIDAGLKAFSVDSGLPRPAGLEDVTYVGASDEHGTLTLGPQAPGLALGQKLRLVPGHCDPTVNLHDWYVGIRNGTVESIWPVGARGAGF